MEPTSFTERMDLCQDDYLSKCPDDIKLEIVSFLTEPRLLCTLSQVSVEWNEFLKDGRIWKIMFQRDFLWWVKKANGQEISPNEGESWRSLYADFYLKGWQWDPNQTNSRIQLSNNNFTANLGSGYTYHGVRTLRGEEKGKHYFEVLIEPAEDNKRFDKGSTIFMGIGIANEKFSVENCCSGWTRENGGIGYYNDGQVYALSERFYPKNSNLACRSGDRVGVELDLDEGFVIFHLNGNPITEPIKGVKGRVYPHLILANDIKQHVSITTGRKTTSHAKPPASPIPVFENALTVLESMGFVNREVCSDLLSRYNGDVELVLNELLA